MGKIYTGPIDAYFDYRLGLLEYHSVSFETELLDMPDFQGNAVVNYTDRETWRGGILSVNDEKIVLSIGGAKNFRKKKTT